MGGALPGPVFPSLLYFCFFATDVGAKSVWKCRFGVFVLTLMLISSYLALRMYFKYFFFFSAVCFIKGAGKSGYGCLLSLFSLPR